MYQLNTKKMGATLLQSAFVFIIAILSAGTAQAQTPYWQYDFTGGSLVDLQGNDNLTDQTGTYSTVTDRFAFSGNAISLDGDSLIGGQEGATDYSISFWIKDAPNDGQLRALVHQFSDFGYSIRLQNGNIIAVGRMAYENNAIPLTPYFSGTRTITGTINVADGNWHHVVYTANNYTASGGQYNYDYKLYIDGVLQGTETATITNFSVGGFSHIGLNNSQTFYVGAHQTGALVRYNNTIDDIAFYKSVLSQTAVNNIFNARVPLTIYVDKDATAGANDGSSWADAFISLKDAADFATVAGDEIWVADGVYTPDASDRSEFFEIGDGVSLYGGFNGTETQLSQRDWFTNETILSGDLSGNDNNNVSYTEATRSENSYKVVFANGDNVIIDGVIIEGGQANNTGTFGEERGSAIYMTTSATTFTLKNSTIRKNVSRVDGTVRATFTGGSSNSVSIQSCRFENNLSRYGSGLTSTTSGNGTTNIEVLNSEFYNNRAADVAGSGSGLTGSSIALFANDATVNAEIINNTFAYNKDYGTSSGQDKGTVVLRRLNDNTSNVVNAEVHNNIFFENESSNGTVNPNAIGLMNRPGNLINTINFTHNNSGQSNFGAISSSGTVSNNINQNPAFIGGATGDFRLSPGSPMIDAGDNSQLPGTITEDVNGSPRIDNGTIDIGANENDPNACFPIAQQPTDQTGCVGQDVTLSVTASEAGAAYQWNFNGSPISGATQASYTINNFQTADAGNYTVDVTTSCGTETSGVAVVTVGSSPVITTQPTDKIRCFGQNFSFQVETVTNQNTFEWQINGDPAPLAGFNNNNVLSLTMNSFVDGAEFRVLVTSPTGCTVVSDTVTATGVQNFIAPTQEPQDQTVCAGQDATFFVVVDPVVSQTYQWYFNNFPISGATDSTLTINNAQPSDAGNYYVEIDNFCAVNAYPTGDATLTVVPASSTTAITTQPSSQTACGGDNVTFTVAATGANLTYQWKKDGVDINGATGASLTLNNVSSADEADYTVEVSGDCGTETSSIAGLTVNDATVITAQPSDDTVCEGGSATFSVTATGGNLTYQWQLDGTNLSGETSSTLSLSNIQLTDAGDYTVVVNGDCGSVTSNIAELTVNPGVNISQQPADQTACVGDDITISVTATGNNLTYQWFKDGSQINCLGGGCGATTPTLSLTNISTGTAGDYSVEITSSCGTISSATANLTVNAATSITTQPGDQTVCEGSNVTFVVEADGANLSYQWQKDGATITGNTTATTDTLVLSNVTTGSAGDYTVVVTGDCGSATSTAATLTVNPGISITQQPVGDDACAGDNVSLSVTANGAGLSYQWTKDGTNINGATTATLNLNSVTTADAGDYEVEITASCGTLTSNTATVTVDDPVAITIQPNDETVCEGDNVTLSVTATGTNLNYQWQKGGSNISGATSSSLQLTGVDANDAGSYTVAISNNCGAVTSNSVDVTVNSTTAITQQPADQVACIGGTATYSVTATGTNLSYQWQKDGTAINGETGTTLQLSNVQNSDVATYTVVVTGDCGTITSDDADLSISTGAAISQQPQNTTVCEGTTATFSVTATGGSLSYQWQKDGSIISGATSATLTINDVEQSDVGNYSVEVSDACGTATSDTVSLSMNAATDITTEPTDQSICEGGTTTFSVVSSGVNQSYQWQLNGTDINGAVSANLQLNSVQLSDAGAYKVIVDGTCGSDTSVEATLTVNATTTITQQPADSTGACQGGDVTLGVNAIGDALAYQWNFEGAPVSGATQSTLALTSIQISDAGRYTVDVSGTCGSAASDTALVTIDTLATPAISRSGNVLSTGTYNSYQWYLDGTALNGETADTLTVTANGDYTVEVSNGNCSTTSAAFTVVNVGIAAIQTVDMTLYPNPFSNTVTLEMGSAHTVAQVTVFDVTGRVVYNASHAQSGSTIHVDLGMLSKGAYQIRVVLGDGNHAVSKLVKY